VIRGRRVFLDYTRNPSGGRKFGEFDLSVLAPEAYGYLEKSNALLQTPIERLRRINQPAVDLFMSHGIGLGHEPLEIAVCAQHNNGGFKANVWWESDVRHLFPVGEVCGTHGVSRPGGSALNAGQVGSRRAAEFIARRYADGPSKPGPFAAVAASQVLKTYDFATSLVEPSAKTTRLLQEATAEIKARMSACGAHVRRADDVARELPRARDLLKRLRRDMRIPRRKLLPRAFEVLGQALTHVLYLESVAEYLGRQGQSRGSFIVPIASGEQACPGFEENWRYTLNGPDDFVSRKILEIGLNGGGKVRKVWVDTRPVPSAASWFETVWNDFINDRIIREDK
jgi:hypothetical protein